MCKHVSNRNFSGFFSSNKNWKWRKINSNLSSGRSKVVAPNETWTFVGHIHTMIDSQAINAGYVRLFSLSLARVLLSILPECLNGFSFALLEKLHAKSQNGSLFYIIDNYVFLLHIFATLWLFNSNQSTRWLSVMLCFWSVATDFDYCATVCRSDV